MKNGVLIKRRLANMSPKNIGGIEVADRSRHACDAARGRSLFRINDRHSVGLPRRNIHVADTERQQQDTDRKLQRGHKRQHNKQNVRR
jgi:hypothetical protein